MTVTVVDAGPRKVSRAAEVHAPARELFAIVADPRRHGELDGSGTVHGTVSGPERLSGGARFSVKMTWYGGPRGHPAPAPGTLPGGLTAPRSLRRAGPLTKGFLLRA